VPLLRLVPVLEPDSLEVVDELPVLGELPDEVLPPVGADMVPVEPVVPVVPPAPVDPVEPVLFVPVVLLVLPGVPVEEEPVPDVPLLFIDPGARGLVFPPSPVLLEFGVVV
jgi:hypothetical protein